MPKFCSVNILVNTKSIALGKAEKNMKNFLLFLLLLSTTYGNVVKETAHCKGNSLRSNDREHHLLCYLFNRCCRESYNQGIRQNVKKNLTKYLLTVIRTVYALNILLFRWGKLWHRKVCHCVTIEEKRDKSSTGQL